MEAKEINRVIISKPIASRPNCTGFGLDFLSGPIDALPSPANSSEMAVAAIRPKTVRAMPAISQAPIAFKFQADTSEVAPNSSSDNISGVQNQSAIFKPLAKVVSKATVSLLASIQQQHCIASMPLEWFPPRRCMVDVPAHPDKLHSSSIQHSSNPSQVELHQSVESLTMLNKKPRTISSSSAGAELASCDGYNWRKYGQKQVKGCEFPRSYYKCTHPKCVVKKKVERSLDWQITEIVYKGEHNHPKPDYVKRSSSGVQGQELVTNQYHNSTDHELHGKTCEKNVGSERQSKNETPERISKLCMFPGLSKDCEDTPKGLKVDDNGTKSKRRKHNNRNNEAGKTGKHVQEPRVWVHSNSEPEIVGDGFHWRKYGQKIVRGNPYPRSYYRCTSLNCNVRKHVERALDDPGTLITTYEGRHNHEIPVQVMNNSAARDPETQTLSAIEDEQ